MGETGVKKPAGVAIVTGASRGIGAAIARLAGASGYAVAVNYAKDRKGAEAVAAEIERAGGSARAIRADVSVEADVVRLFAEADRLGPLALLVNNAGVTGRLGRVDALTAEDLRAVFDVNIAGAFLCAREAVRRMSTRRGGAGGAIVNLSSRAAQIGGAGDWVHYAAAKGAIDTLTVGLAREVAAEGIRVNAVAPGLIATGLHAAAGAPDRVARMAPTVPMGRAGTPEEVAACVLWLASPEAAYVTGAILPVTGGR
ncbi:MAG: SDR family oxidoreductase [Rhodospirillales bacterium]|nr:SDR family oxidoreductase [Rhodospirillales bacterium]